MDALARVAPIARPLLRDVDDVLATLGAPAEHPVWALLRRLRTTPADAVTFFVDLTPERLRLPASTLRELAMIYDNATIPHVLPWENSVADLYTASATAFDRHVRSSDGVHSLAGRLRATASYVDGVAGWCQRSRDNLARTVAQAMTSSQAVTVRSFPTVGRGLAEMMRVADSSGDLAGAVTAAADIGAAILGVAEDAAVAAHSVHHDTAGSLAELVFRAPAQNDPTRHDGTIRLHH
jgi:hypothetical protein